MDDQTIGIFSIVSAKTKEGLVQLKWGENGCQMTPEEARQHAYGILDAANAAESDSIMYKFLVDIVKLPPENAFLLFKEFRQMREKHAPVADGIHKHEKPE